MWNIGAALFIVLTPVLLITTSARFVINLPALYSYGFDRYRIEDYTRIKRGDLIAAGAQIRDYFNNGERDLIIRTFVGGVLVESLYNEREILHMRDVKALVRGMYGAQLAVALYMAGFAAAGFALRGRGFGAALLRYVRFGGVFTLALTALTGLGALVGFDRLFLAFHIISFSNDLWQLDPRRDYLIAMFPQGFFFDATMLIAFCAVSGAALFAAAPAIARLAARLLARRRSGA